MFEQHAHGRIGLEGYSTGEKLVQYDSQRIYVGTSIHRLAAGLLGTHIGWRTGNLPAGGLLG